LSTWGARPADLVSNYRRLDTGDDGEVTEMRIRNGNIAHGVDEENVEEELKLGSAEEMDV
jgi:hypothetical protein